MRMLRTNQLAVFVCSASIEEMKCHWLNVASGSESFPNSYGSKDVKTKIAGIGRPSSPESVFLFSFGPLDRSSKFKYIEI